MNISGNASAREFIRCMGFEQLLSVDLDSDKPAVADR